MNYSLDDVISGISTPLGSGGIGIVRLSGNGAFDIADKIFKSPKGKKLSEQKSHSIVYGNIVDFEGRKTDEVLVSVMKAPKTYTCEDVVEINCHGGIVVLNKVYELTLQAGARPAEAGEFTKRAFLNGKLDLTEAEAVADLIEAEGERALKAALCQKDGALRRKADALADRLKLWCSHLAAVLDFPEEDVEEIDRAALFTGVSALLRDLNALIDTYRRSSPIRNGITVAIVGRPNVGKSSLLNSLSGEECAIVTDIAGTTRDVVSARVELGGLAVTLLDTAGIRETDDVIEAEGVRRSLSACDKADLILAVFDGSVPLGEEDTLLLTELAGRGNALCIISKGDRPLQAEKARLKEVFSDVLEVSSVTGQGIERLEEALIKRLRLEEFHPEDGMLANERQLACVRNAADCCQRAADALQTGMTLDTVSVELEQALGELYTLSGRRASDSIIDDVFSRFCVGK